MNNLANLGLMIGNSISGGMGSIGNAIRDRNENERLLQLRLDEEARKRGYVKEDFDRSRQLAEEDRNIRNQQAIDLENLRATNQTRAREAELRLRASLSEMESIRQEARELAANGVLGVLTPEIAAAINKADLSDPESLAAAKAQIAQGRNVLSSLVSTDRTNRENNLRIAAAEYAKISQKLDGLDGPIILTDAENEAILQAGNQAVAGMKVNDPEYNATRAKAKAQAKEMIEFQKQQQRNAERASLIQRQMTIDELAKQGVLTYLQSFQVEQKQNISTDVGRDEVEDFAKKLQKKNGQSKDTQGEKKAQSKPDAAKYGRDSITGVPNKYPLTSLLGFSERLPSAVANVAALPGRVMDGIANGGTALANGIVTGDFTIPKKGVLQRFGESIGDAIIAAGSRVGGPQKTNSLPSLSPLSAPTTDEAEAYNQLRQRISLRKGRAIAANNLPTFEEAKNTPEFRVLLNEIKTRRGS